MSGFRQAVRELLWAIATNEPSRYTTPWRHARTEAEKRSHQLLVGNLSPSQCEQYRTRGYFEVVGGNTGTRYRIHRGYQMNVEELDRKGRRIRFLCFMPEGAIPVGDVMLAQKIALELFEADAIRVANRSPAWDDTLAAEIRIRRRSLHY